MMYMEAISIANRAFVFPELCVSPKRDRTGTWISQFLISGLSELSKVEQIRYLQSAVRTHC